MAQPYVGEIRMFAGNFAPAGWMFCEGQLLPISEYETLFNLIGTTYGGDGQSTFALPDLRGRIPSHISATASRSRETGGAETITLTVPRSRTFPPVSGHHKRREPGHYLEQPGRRSIAAASRCTIEDAAGRHHWRPRISRHGGSQPHDNVQPYLCVDFIISLFGIFPSQT